jgi:hypothetical protein
MLLNAIRSSSADFVACQSGSTLWTGRHSFDRNAALLKQSDADYLWQPILLRNEETMNLFPRLTSPSHYRIRQCAWSIPWQTLMITKQHISRLPNLADSIALLELRHYLATSATGIFQSKVNAVVQNSAGRGRRHQTVSDLNKSINYAAKLTGRRREPATEWRCLIESGVIAMNDLDSV